MTLMSLSATAQTFLESIEAPREALRLTNGWRFTREDSSDFVRPDYDDRSWQSVTVPHDWAIFEREYNLAGTLDLLAQDYNGDFVLFDWKRSRRMGKEDGYDFVPNTYNPHSPGLNGLEHLYSTPYVIGCLQQNLYRHILRAGYGIEVKSMYLVALNPAFSRYYCLPVPVMDKEIEHILFCIGKH